MLTNFLDVINSFLSFICDFFEYLTTVRQLNVLCRLDKKR